MRYILPVLMPPEPLGLTMNDSTLPIFLSVDDPFVRALAHESASNRLALESAERMGKSTVMVVQMPSIGEYVLVFPRGAFGEKLIDMEKTVLWALNGAIEKLKSAYMDMDEDIEAAKEVKKIVRDIQALREKLDKKGWENE